MQLVGAGGQHVQQALPGELVDAPDEVRLQPDRPGEIPGSRVSADTSTLALVDMSPEQLIPFRTGIAQTVAWYAEHWLPDWKLAQLDLASAQAHVCTDDCTPGNCARKDF